MEGKLLLQLTPVRWALVSYPHLQCHRLCIRNALTEPAQTHGLGRRSPGSVAVTSALDVLLGSGRKPRPVGLFLTGGGWEGSNLTPAVDRPSVYGEGMWRLVLSLDKDS